MADQRSIQPQLDWVRVSFMTALHIVALLAVVRSVIEPPVGPSVVLGIIWLFSSGFSITAGYHRLFSHRSYRCSRAVAAVYLLFGAAAIQNSALIWVSAHRRHHANTDQDDDPYDARRGLWWSHIGWLLQARRVIDYSNVADLSRDRLVMLQHRFYPALAVAMAGVVPTFIASTWGDPLGGLLWAGCLRLVVQYHATFAINSVAHRFGRRPYSTTTSARDNILVAALTLGEGYHNFHHCFPYDYRNGAGRLDIDATKWFIGALAIVGLASDLKRASPQAVRRVRQTYSHEM